MLSLSKHSDYFVSIGVCIGVVYPYLRLRRTPSSSCSGRSMTSTRTRGWPRSSAGDGDRQTRLGVGPMGFGGAASLIGCKVGVLNRLPASFFVSMAYDCWASPPPRRRAGPCGPAPSAMAVPRPGAGPSIPMVDAAAGTQAFRG